ncbi:hypothetical protein FOYG_09480 [Fusarium oxysporum NRRL 32931]|uniref:Uncharacterized protein n=1 Tax=Fusarium oxysporum NRRL 32931 TaxID=660029 RepID=W9I0N0_FUSOX|nr:hypothetical protein FOYG_09480 [Fusarium oxysporum NRRL 32931]
MSERRLPFLSYITSFSAPAESFFFFSAQQYFSTLPFSGSSQTSCVAPTSVSAKASSCHHTKPLRLFKSFSQGNIGCTLGMQHARLFTIHPAHLNAECWAQQNPQRKPSPKQSKALLRWI